MFDIIIQSTDHLNEFLKSSIEELKNVRKISFINNTFERLNDDCLNQLDAVLKNCSKLQVIDLSNTNLKVLEDNNLFFNFIKIIENCTELKKIILKNSNLGELQNTSLALLTTTVFNSKNIGVLDLTSNNNVIVAIKAYSQSFSINNDLLSKNLKEINFKLYTHAKIVAMALLQHNTEKNITESKRYDIPQHIRKLIFSYTDTQKNPEKLFVCGDNFSPTMLQFRDERYESVDTSISNILKNRTHKL